MERDDRTGDSAEGSPCSDRPPAADSAPQDHLGVQDVVHGAPAASDVPLLPHEPGGPGQARLGDLAPPPSIEVHRGDLSMLGGKLTIAPQRSTLFGPTSTLAGIYAGVALALGPVFYGSEPTYLDSVLRAAVTMSGGALVGLGGTAAALRNAWHVSYEVSDGTIRAVKDGKVVAVHETNRVVALKFNRYAGFLGSLIGGKNRHDELPQSKNAPEGRVESPYLQLWLDDRTASKMQVFPPIAVWGRDRMQAAERDLRRACGLPDDP